MTAPPSRPAAYRRLAAAALFAAAPAAPAAAQVMPVDPTVVALAKQALAAAEAPTIVKTKIVGTDVAGTPPVADPGQTLGNSPIQVVGATPNDTGYLAFKYGNDGKGIANYWAKTRGTKPNSFDALRAGDRIVTDYWQAGTGGQTGHAGAVQVAVDANIASAGEVAGRWSLATGSGIHVSQVSPQYPARYGVLNAIVANSYQQVLFPGGATGVVPATGANFGGWVVIGAGASAPGFGPLKFQTAGAALLAVPEAGAFEVDTAARPYFTAADGVRRAFVLADPAAPTVRALSAAGAGASVAIDASGNAGVVTLKLAGGGASGDLFAVTYARPYGSASYPVLTAGNQASVPLVNAGYVTATATGFTFTVPAGVATATTYLITFNAPGK